MGLIECSDCGKKISDSAKECNRCGNRNTPINKKIKKRQKEKLKAVRRFTKGGMILILIIFGIITAPLLLIGIITSSAVGSSPISILIPFFVFILFIYFMYRLTDKTMRLDE